MVSDIVSCERDSNDTESSVDSKKACCAERSEIYCHTEAFEGEVSNVESKQDFSPMAQNDKILESVKSKTPSVAEVSCDDFVGCEAFFARSYLSGSAEAKKANSRKSTQETTQNLDSINSKIQDSVLNFLTQLEQNFNGGGGKYTGFYSL